MWWYVTAPYTTINTLNGAVRNYDAASEIKIEDDEFEGYVILDIDNMIIKHADYEGISWNDMITAKIGTDNTNIWAWYFGSASEKNTVAGRLNGLLWGETSVVDNKNEFIKKVYGLNFNDTNYPEFEIYDEEEIDQTTAERDNKVLTLGVKFTKKYIQKAYGYEDDDFEMVEFKQDMENIEFADVQDDDFTKMEQVVENFSTEDYDKVINEALKPVLEMFKTSRNAEECMEMLAEIYPDMKTEELEKTLTKVIFLAELMGRVE